MAKNGKMDFTKQIVESAVAGDNAPVLQVQFAQEIQKLNWLTELLAQQIMGLDIAMGLLIERVAKNFERVENEDGTFTVKITQWTQEQWDDFKAEQKRRVEVAAKKIAEHSATLNKSIIV